MSSKAIVFLSLFLALVLLFNSAVTARDLAETSPSTEHDVKYYEGGGWDHGHGEDGDGHDGEHGQDGGDGHDGEHGHDGGDGHDGEHGHDGVDGHDGEYGHDGEDGHDSGDGHGGEYEHDGGYEGAHGGPRNGEGGN